MGVAWTEFAVVEGCILFGMPFHHQNMHFYLIYLDCTLNFDYEP